MLERFTDRAIKVMHFANAEAKRFNHEFIGTEHFLLGILQEGNGVGANVLKNFNLDLGQVLREVEKIILPGPKPIQKEILPQTPRAKRVIQFALEEFQKLHHNYLGTEHLLLGLLREEEGVAAQVLGNLGVSLEMVRLEVAGLLEMNLGFESEEDQSALPELPVDAEIQHLPENARRIALLFNQLLDHVEQAEENEVASHKLEEAAFFRGIAAKVKKLKERFLRHWPEL